MGPQRLPGFSLLPLQKSLISHPNQQGAELPLIPRGATQFGQDLSDLPEL